MNVVIHQIYVGHSKAVFILLTRCIIRGKVGSKLCKVLTPNAPQSFKWLFNEASLKKLVLFKRAIDFHSEICHKNLSVHLLHGPFVTD